MTAPVSHHHSVTRFSIVGVPAIVYIFHPRGGGDGFVACGSTRYTWVTHVNTCSYAIRVLEATTRNFPFINNITHAYPVEQLGCGRFRLQIAASLSLSIEPSLTNRPIENSLTDMFLNFLLDLNAG